MVTPGAVCADAIPSTCNDEITESGKYDYVTVREASTLLEKGQSRLYRMIEEGLLSEVGLLVLRTKKGRIWIGIPRCGPTELVLAKGKEP